jgi:leader peptidase (prepilin peptidase)/N-methyltransferase
MTVLILLSIFIFGTLLGSFLNVVIWRLPRGQSLGGRSRCPHCSAVLRPGDLVPVLSFLFLGRRCRHCGAGISSRYAAVELVTGLLFAWSWYVINPAGLDSYAVAIRLLILVAFFIAIFWIDLEHYLILDKLVLPAATITLAANVIVDSIRHTPLLSLSGYTAGGVVAAAGLAGFFFLLWLVSRGKWIGLGDVKLAVVLGLAVGWPQVLVSTMLAFLMGTFVSITLLLRGTKGLKSPIPFGTFLTLGTLLALWYGPQIWHWYLGLIGL